MRSIGAVGVVCLAVVPAFGSPVDYTFDVISSSSDIVLTIEQGGSTTMSMDGTFTVSVNQSDGHIGSSDILLLKGIDIANAEAGQAVCYGYRLTATIDQGDLRLTDFIEDANYTPAHIGAGGTFTAYADVAVEVTLHLTGWFTTTVTADTSAGEPLEINGTITTSAEDSDTITMTLDFVATSISVWIPIVSSTLHLDLDVHLEATAHQAPDPSLGGLVALGLGGAGTWLRRRRRV